MEERIKKGKKRKHMFIKMGWDNWISTCKSTKLDPFLKPSAKINSKRIMDLNVRAKP